MPEGEGKTRQGKARHGMARHGKARQGKARKEGEIVSPVDERVGAPALEKERQTDG